MTPIIILVRPGAVGGNAPGNSLSLGLRRRGGIAGAGLRDGLPAGPLGGGTQPRATRTVHITAGLLLSRERSKITANTALTLEIETLKM